MSQDLSHYIPRRLDDKGKFLFWELDVAAVALLGMLVGVAT
jgi:conjugal transfer pilus assembly protein TraL